MSSHVYDNFQFPLAGSSFKGQGLIDYITKEEPRNSNLFARMLYDIRIEANSFGESNRVVGEV